VAQVLIVEDDPRIRPLLMRSLGEMGYAVASVSTGMAGLAMAVETRPDLVILDLGLPDCGRHAGAVDAAGGEPGAGDRRQRPRRRPLADRLFERRGRRLRGQAVHHCPVEARIRAVMRGATGDGPRTRRKELSVGGLTLDSGARTAILDGTALDLSPRVRPARPAGREHRRGGDQEGAARRRVAPGLGGSDKTVDVHLSWLRRKLGETAAEPRYLHTVRGVGVRLSPPGE
jgi:two-component system response regulator PrrA